MEWVETRGVSPCRGDKSSPWQAVHPDKNVSALRVVWKRPEEGLAGQSRLVVDLEPQRWSLAWQVLRLPMGRDTQTFLAHWEPRGGLW